MVKSKTRGGAVQEGSAEPVEPAVESAAVSAAESVTSTPSAAAGKSGAEIKLSKDGNYVMKTYPNRVELLRKRHKDLNILGDDYKKVIEYMDSKSRTTPIRKVFDNHFVRSIREVYLLNQFKGQIKVDGQDVLPQPSQFGFLLKSIDGKWIIGKSIVEMIDWEGLFPNHKNAGKPIEEVKEKEAPPDSLTRVFNPETGEDEYLPPDKVAEFNEKHTTVGNESLPKKKGFFSSLFGGAGADGVSDEKIECLKQFFHRRIIESKVFGGKLTDADFPKHKHGFSEGDFLNVTREMVYDVAKKIMQKKDGFAAISELMTQSDWKKQIAEGLEGIAYNVHLL
jgi:hypothetical protein